LRRWVAGLPLADKDEMLVRLLRGDAGLLRSELLREFRGVRDGSLLGKGRTAGALLAAAGERWAARQQQKRDRDAAGAPASGGSGSRGSRAALEPAGT
jgi:hypothetical protein